MKDVEYIGWCVVFLYQLGDYSMGQCTLRYIMRNLTGYNVLLETLLLDMHSKK